MPDRALKTFGTIWVSLTFLISFISFGWQGFAKINESQNTSTSLVGGFFSGFAPAFVTCLFSVEVLKFFADEDRSKKPLFMFLLILMAITLGQWKTMPEVNGLNTAFDNSFSDEDTLEVLQWSLLPVLLFVRSINGFSTIAWQDKKPEAADPKTTLQQFQSFAKTTPAMALAAVLGYSVSGGVSKAIETIPSELSYPIIHYMEHAPDLLNTLLFTGFFTWQYTKPVKLGAEHLIKDLKAILSCQPYPSTLKQGFKKFLSSGFLSTAILFPPISQWFQSEAAGESNKIILSLVFLTSLLINRSGMSILYPRGNAKIQTTQIDAVKALTFFGQETQSTPDETFEPA